MSEKPTRMNLDEAGEGRTDWQRVRSQSDAEIDAAIAADSDADAVSEAELARFAAMRARYEVLQAETGMWHWRLVRADGTVLAVDGGGFASRRGADDAIRLLRSAVLAADLRAA